MAVRLQIQELIRYKIPTNAGYPQNLRSSPHITGHSYCGSRIYADILLQGGQIQFNQQFSPSKQGTADPRAALFKGCDFIFGQPC